MTVRPIADDLGLSATPIKAALVALERDGVLISRLHRGFFVPELSIDDMAEIYEMREALDCIASRRVAMSPDRVAIADRLAEHVQDQRLSLAAQDRDAYRELDLVFHRDLWVLCGNQRLRRTAESLLDQMRLSNSLSARLPGRMAHSVEEHAQIVETIRSGDPDAAEAAVREHVRTSFVSFCASQQRVPLE